jgi:hypothetical protein
VEARRDRVIRRDRKFQGAWQKNIVDFVIRFNISRTPVILSRADNASPARTEDPSNVRKSASKQEIPRRLRVSE